MRWRRRWRWRRWWRWWRGWRWWRRRRRRRRRQGVPHEVRLEEARRGETAAGAQHGPDAIGAETDDIGAAIACHVDGEAWMLIHPPALVVTQVAHDQLWRGERAIAIVQGEIDPGVAETHDVGLAVAGHIGQQPQVAVHTPALVQTERLQHKSRGGEAASSVAKRRPDPVIAKADDVRAPIAGQIDDEARMKGHLPAASIDAEIPQHAARRGEPSGPVT